MTRLIRHLSKDISRLTRFEESFASRLCFLLGAREAVINMLSVRDAAPNLFLQVNQSNFKNKDIINSFKSMGYEVKQNPYFKDILNFTVRKRIPPTSEDEETIEGAEFFSPEYISDHNVKFITVSRDTAIEVSMGQGVISSDILDGNGMEKDDEVMVIDKYKNYLAYGTALMSFEEAKRSPGRQAINIKYSLYDVPKFYELKLYRQGAYSLLTLPRIVGIKALNPKPKGKYLAVIQDNGETLSYMAELMNREGEIFVYVRNDTHLKAIRDTLKRTNVESDGEHLNIVFETKPLERHLKRLRTRHIYEGFYYEPVNSRSGLRPQFFSELEEKEVLSFSRNQLQGLRSSVLALKQHASIIYVTHSLDPTENQDVIMSSFEQDFFEPTAINDKAFQSLKKLDKKEIHSLPEIPTATQADRFDPNILINQQEPTFTWININPQAHGSDAGFVAKLRLFFKEKQK